MIATKPKYIFLYLIGVAFLAFGNRQFWGKFQEEKLTEIREGKMAELAAIESNKAFEIQHLEYDSVKNVWKNNHISFVRLNLGSVHFRDLPQTGLSIETNDYENASDSL